LEDEACPAQFSDVVTGAPCSAGSVQCSFLQGVCSCDTGANPQAQHPLQWVCAPVPQGCPTHPPLLGQPCNGEALLCDYGSCKFQHAQVMVCSNGVWTPTIPTSRCF